MVPDFTIYKGKLEKQGTGNRTGMIILSGACK